MQESEESSDNSVDDIDPRTLSMIESGIEAMKNGNVSEPIDMERDFPGLFDDEEV